MKRKQKNLRLKALMALGGIKNVLGMPRYAVLAVVLTFLFAVLIYLFTQIGFYGPLLLSKVSLVDKTYLVATLAVEMLLGMATTINGAILAIVALLQGVAFAAMVYIMRRNKRFDTGAVGSGGIAMLATAVGLGCVPCGTSLIMPLVTLFFSTSAYAAASMANMVVLMLAFLLSLYSLYKLGNVAYVHVAVEKEHEGGVGNGAV